MIVVLTRIVGQLIVLVTHVQFTLIIHGHVEITTMKTSTPTRCAAFAKGRTALSATLVVRRAKGVKSALLDLLPHQSTPRRCRTAQSAGKVGMEARQTTETGVKGA